MRTAIRAPTRTHNSGNLSTVPIVYPCVIKIALQVAPRYVRPTREKRKGKTLAMSTVCTGQLLSRRQRVEGEQPAGQPSLSRAAGVPCRLARGLLHEARERAKQPNARRRARTHRVVVVGYTRAFVLELLPTGAESHWRQHCRARQPRVSLSANHADQRTPHPRRSHDASP